VQAIVWSDYLCPWCYLGQARTSLLCDLGVTVRLVPFELHPNLAVEGRPMGERGQKAYARLAELCSEAGLPFRIPAVVPNTRDAHRAALWLAETVDVTAVDGYHRAVFDAYFVRGEFIGDPDVVDALLVDAGGSVSDYRTEVATGELDERVLDFREQAIDAGATGAPSWFIEDRFLIPGVQDPGYFERVIARLNT
jgi:predicted DsbA family dithiol-disulfide isomerase